MEWNLFIPTTSHTIVSPGSFNKERKIARMPETLYNQIMNAPYDYLDDINIKPLGKGEYLVSRYGVGSWYWLDLCASLPTVLKLLEGYRQLLTPATPFT